MKNYEFLYELTGSLSKAEKRYFKLYSSLQTGDKNYLKVFDEVESQKNYNESKIKNKFKGEKLINNFSVTKAYIIDQVLKSLRNYNTKGSIDSQLQNELLNIEILYQKGILPLAYKHLKRALKIAIEHEKFGIAISILNWERRIAQIWDFPPRDEFTISQQEAHIQLQHKNILEFQSLRHKLNSFKKKYGSIKNNEELEIFNNIMNHTLLDDFDNVLSKRATFYFYLLNALKESYFSNHELAYEYSIKSLESVSASIDEMEYLDGTLSFISIGSFAGKHAECVQVFEELKEKLSDMTVGQFKPVQNIIFFYQSNFHILNLININRIDDAVKDMEFADKTLAERGDRISSEYRMVIHDVLFYSYFTLGRHKDALAQINILLNDYSSQLRSDVVYGSKIYNLAIHFEMGNYDLLTYLIASTKRFFNKHSQYPEFEHAYLNFLKKRITTTDKDEIIELNQNLFNTLVKLSREYHSKYNDGIEINFVLYWLYSGLNNIPMYQAMNNPKLSSIISGNQKSSSTSLLVN